MSKITDDDKSLSGVLVLPPKNMGWFFFSVCIKQVIKLVSPSLSEERIAPDKQVIRTIFNFLLKSDL